MKARDTKRRLLQIGIDQISVSGLAGVTLGQLATASGLSKSGLFAHFKSKEQLQIELLQTMAEYANQLIFAPAMQVPQGLERLTAVMESWRGWWRRAGLSGGCPVAAALFELDDIDSEVRDVTAKMEKEWRERLGALVVDAKRLGQLSPKTDVDQFVWELCANYLGHHVSARFLREDDADARAKMAFEALIQRHCPPGCAAESEPEA